LFIVLPFVQCSASVPAAQHRIAIIHFLLLGVPPLSSHTDPRI
jgi:hypothetical protein